MKPGEGVQLPPWEPEGMNMKKKIKEEDLKVGTYTSDLQVLTSLKEGAKGKLTYVFGGKMVVKRLLNMGLTLGTDITVTGKSVFRGPIVITVRGSTLILGKGIASKVYLKVE